jgi:ankyrin repeat protein
MLLTQDQKDSKLWNSLNDPKKLREALAIGAHTDVTGNDGSSALMHALAFNGAIMFDQLKAYTDDKEKEALKDLPWKERFKHKFMTAVLEGMVANGNADRMKSAEILINADANINIVDKEGKTALLNAVILNGVQGGADKIIRKLVDKGADLNVSYKGHTVLEWAQLSEKQPGIVKLLKSKGASTTPPAPLAKTPPAANTP